MAELIEVAAAYPDIHTAGRGEEALAILDAELAKPEAREPWERAE